MDLVALMKSLSDATGVSGYEDEVRALVRQSFEASCDDIRQDAMGSLIGLRRGTQRGERNRRRIMIAGHMDEIGLMVSRLDEGFLRFTQVGGYDVRILPGQSVIVHGRKRLPGVIGSRPPHTAAGAKGVTPMDELFIDVGLSAGALAKQVEIGDWVTMDATCTELGGDLLCGKAMDDRAGVAAVIACLDELTRLPHEWDVYGVATVQEEIGLRGAFTSTYGVAPDVGIAVDVGFGKQPGVPEAQQEILGKGPTMTIGPNVHPALFKHIKDTADLNEIPVQSSVTARGTGTDANAMQITRAGIPAALLSIPVRNMHTPVETLSVKDLRRTGRLLARSIAGMGKDFIKSLTWATTPSGGDTHAT
ncbi:MAG: M42 family metallopeptidase [Verrucomicrobia bacterium]|nr:M42 family metallopeptidase [Verrucomicrobiota bacterium]